MPSSRKASIADRPPAPALPTVRRARGFRLYDIHGRRYLDLWRDGGGALLGHRAGSAGTLMKSALSQGLAAGLPSAWEERLLRALRAMFPSCRAIRLFSSRTRALEAASLFLGMRVEPPDLYDPALGAAAPAGARAALWRPLLPHQTPRAWDVLLPVLPLSVCGAPAPVCLAEEPRGAFPASDRIPGFILAGAVRALADLGALSRGKRFADPRIEKVINGSGRWKRAGPYVSPAFDRAEYPRVFDAFLAQGVLLAPAHPGPSILPGECSPGETRLLADLFAGIPGG